jgi:lysophospholipase L1-like esterase
MAQGLFVPSTADQKTASGLSNLKSANLPYWRRAIAKVRTASGRGKVVIIGDSTTAGAGSGSSGTSLMVGAAANAWPKKLAAIPNSPVPFLSNSWWATQGCYGASGVTLPTYDPRVALGANWAPNLTTLGGQLIRYATGAVNNLSFTPTGAFDTIVVYFVKNNSNGSATVNVDGGASLGTLNTNNASLVLGSQSFTCTKGTHTINIVPNNDNQLFILGIQTYDSTSPAIDILSTSSYGALASTFTANVNVYDPRPVLRFLAPDLTIICLTINDSNNGTALATYLANVQLLITDGKLSGDVVLMVGAPSNTTQATDGTLDSFIAGLTALAQTNGCPLINLKTRWTSYAVTNPVLPYGDTLHPGNLGYADKALAVYEALVNP